LAREDKLFSQSRKAAKSRKENLIIDLVSLGKLVAVVVAFVVVAVPFVVVGDLTVFAFPVALVVHAAFMARRDPACAGVGRTSPVAVVPFVATAYRVPVADDPDITGTGTGRLNADDAGSRRRADSDSD
jgi:hypothetical protein